MRNRTLWFENLLRDINFAIRQIVKNPGFAAVTILVLALGIGASTSIFSVADAVLLRPLPYPNPEQIDRIDAGKIADCLRCDFLPECHMASTEIRDRRRTLRYRHLVARQMVQMKNRVSGLLIESGVSYDKQRLHKMGYYTELLSTNEEISDSIRPLLRVGREHILRGQRLDRALISSLETGSAAIGAAETAENDPRSGSHHRPDLGPGDRRLHPLPIGEGSHPLLRTMQY